MSGKFGPETSQSGRESLAIPSLHQAASPHYSARDAFGTSAFRPLDRANRRSFERQYPLWQFRRRLMHRRFLWRGTRRVHRRNLHQPRLRSVTRWRRRGRGRSRMHRMTQVHRNTRGLDLWLAIFPRQVASRSHQKIQPHPQHDQSDQGCLPAQTRRPSARSAHRRRCGSRSKPAGCSPGVGRTGSQCSRSMQSAIPIPAKVREFSSRPPITKLLPPR